MNKIYTHDFCGKELKITIGKLAEQANGETLIQCGDTVVLSTAVASKSPREGIDFFPLSCDFEERQYSVGKIPGGFIKREGRPTEKAVLTSRLIDRPLRPLFPDGYRNDVQIVATAFSVDQDFTPDILAIIGSSLALTISDIPFDGPIAAVSVAYVDNEYILYPNQEERDNSSLQLTVAGSKDAITMVESESNILTEEEILEAILLAHGEIKKLCKFMEEIRSDIGKDKMEIEVLSINKSLETDVKNFAKDKIKSAMEIADTNDRASARMDIEKEVLLKFKEEYLESEKDIKLILQNIEKDVVRKMIVEESIRPDRRGLDEVRPISTDVNFLPRTHGSVVFTRGQTQVLTVATLGAPGDAQSLDGIMDEDDKVYMHHYNFPPYSVGDTRPMRGPGRREIGHGALAERALIPVLPDSADFPYTMRVVSEVLSSNGSSSMASVCGSSLSLMDAGVPIKAAVAGIAMGLIQEGDKTAILTDILGLEDHLGDMDFKVAGTNKGITAMQMDIKLTGISREILEEALEKARIARIHILDEMNKALSEHRNDLSPFAPRIFRIEIDPDKVREVIGPGGKVINGIISETGVKIDTEDDGTITVTGQDGPSGEKAVEMIDNIVKEPETGETYMGKVTRIMNFGAFMEILPGKEGLLHISNIAHEHIDKVEDVLSVGDEMLVKVSEIDRQGRVNLSRKALLSRDRNSSKSEKKSNDRNRHNNRRRNRD